MRRTNGLITAACLSATLLTPAMVSAVPLGEYEQAASNPTKQMTIFRSDFQTTVADMLADLRNRHFKDGKEKSFQRIQSDLGRAERIEHSAPRLAANQAKALISLISAYAAAQPNTDLRDVIASFLLAGALNPQEREFQQYNESGERYEATHRTFMENMETWKRTTDKAQADLEKEQADIDRRDKELTDPSSHQ